MVVERAHVSQKKEGREEKNGISCHSLCAKVSKLNSEVMRTPQLKIVHCNFVFYRSESRTAFSICDV